MNHLRADWHPELASLIEYQAPSFFSDSTDNYADIEALTDKYVERLNQEIERKIRYIEREATYGRGPGLKTSWVNRWEQGKTDAEIAKALMAYRRDMTKAMRAGKRKNR